MYRAVLFDIDGTLVDSNDAHASAWVDVLGANGHPVAFERVRPLIGKGGDKLLPELTGIDPQSEQGQTIAAERRRRFRDAYMPTRRATRAFHDALRSGEGGLGRL